MNRKVAGLLLVYITVCPLIANAQILQEPKLWTKIEITDPDGRTLSTVEKKLVKTLDRMGVVVEETSNYLLRGKVDIVDEATVEGYKGSQTVVSAELLLSFVFLKTNSTLGSETFTAKGMGNSREQAFKEACRNFKIGKSELSELFERAEVLLKEKLDQLGCNAYQKGKEYYDKKEHAQALGLLSTVTKGTSCYEEAQKLIKVIKREQWQIWQERLRHQEKMAEEEAKAAQAHADSIKAEVRKAEAHAKRMADSLEILKKQEQIEETKLLQIEKEAEQAKWKAEEMKSKLKLEELKVKEYYDEADLMKRVRENQPDKMPNDVIYDLTRPELNEMIPSDLVGTWNANSESKGRFRLTVFTLTFQKDGIFSMEVQPANDDFVMAEGTFTVLKNLLILRPRVATDDSYTNAQRLYFQIVDGEIRLVLTDLHGNSIKFTKVF